jgi:hypothetical protein
MEIIKKLNPLALVLEPREVYDEAVIDVDESGRAVYSIEKVIECGVKLFETHKDSIEWYGYNTFSAYLGEMTLKYVSEIEDEE